MLFAALAPRSASRPQYNLGPHHEDVALLSAVEGCAAVQRLSKDEEWPRVTISLVAVLREARSEALLRTRLKGTIPARSRCLHLDPAHRALSLGRLRHAYRQ